LKNNDKKEQSQLMLLFKTNNPDHELMTYTIEGKPWKITKQNSKSWNDEEWNKKNTINKGSKKKLKKWRLNMI
jgi:hypothetical protein